MTRRTRDDPRHKIGDTLQTKIFTFFDFQFWNERSWPFKKQKQNCSLKIPSRLETKNKL